MKKFLALILAAMMVLACGCALAADDIDASKKVDKLEIGALPAKTAYVVGDTFSMEGGTVIVTYDDGSTDEVPMTASGISVKEPGMKASGTKTVTLKAGKKSARFTVDVANNSFQVTYDLNYDGAPQAEAVEVVKGQTAEEKTPVREGYTFAGWYVDPDFTKAYDFKSVIADNLSLYALWQKDGAQFASVTFDYGYYGPALSSYSYPVEVGTPVARPSIDPVRTGYTFSQWVDIDGAAVDFSQPVAADMTITAAWDKTVSGKNEWVFEAEDTNLSGKTGPAVSGTANEVGMIVAYEDRNISNGRGVSYLYQFGNSLEFYIACDEDVSDATLSLSLSAEMESLSLNSGNFGIYLNDEKLDYQPIEITDVPAFDLVTYTADVPNFQYFVLGENMSLKAGKNLLRVVTENNESYSGTTMTAHAPIVDALKVETEGVVIWDENYGVPALDNYKQ